MKLVFLAMMYFFSSASAFAEDGSAGIQGQTGDAGANGANGAVVLLGLKCVVSANIEHLKMCLAEGRSVNERKFDGETIFQIAVESNDLSMLQTICENPDPNNKPDLRVKFTRVASGSPSLNIYELLLYRRVSANENWEAVRIDSEELENQLYVDNDQVAMLKVLLSIETDASALQKETRDILVHLKASKYNGTPSVQNAIAEISKALSRKTRI